MATRRWDEGLLGWLLIAAALAGGTGLIALGRVLGGHLAHAGDAALLHIDSAHD